MDAISIEIETNDRFTIKFYRSTIHIAGITTPSGREVCSAVATVRSLDTGHTFGSLADALTAMDHNRRTPCRVCRVAALMILNR
jgi:hypothetical protein